jgi:putative copper export protein
MSPDLLSVVIRTLGFIGLYQAAGAAFFMLLFEAWLPRSSAGIRRLGFWAALAGIVLLAARQELEAARMADSFAGLVDPNLLRLTWTGSSGNAALFELIGLGVVAFGLTQRGSPFANIASTGAAIAVVAATLTGHTSVHPQRVLLAPLLAVHLILVAFWFGALVPLILCSRRDSREHALSVLRGFSGVAGPLVPCIGVAGLAMALILIPDSTAWRSTYGLLILGKLSVFAALLLLAAWNRWRSVPAMALTHAAAAGQALRRAIGIEYLLMITVLGATAVLTSFNSP